MGEPGLAAGADGLCEGGDVGDGYWRVGCWGGGGEGGEKGGDAVVKVGEEKDFSGGGGEGVE